jgi:prefoldin subunit 5
LSSYNKYKKRYDEDKDFEIIRKNKQLEEAKGFVNKVKVLVPRIAENRYVMLAFQIFMTVFTAVLIYISFSKSISELKNTINDMTNEITLLQQDLSSATNTIQLMQDNMNNLLQQLDTQNETIFELQSREQQIANILNNLNLNQTIEIVNILNQEIQQINSSVTDLQYILANDVTEIKEIYNSTMNNIYNQTNTTINSLRELNYTLWQKETEIDAILYNILNNISNFENDVNNDIQNLTQQLTALSYSFGTFIPVLNFEGITAGITYTTQVGEYVRIGNMVNIVIYIVLSSTCSWNETWNGYAFVNGLPFSSTNDNCLIYDMFMTFIRGNIDGIITYFQASLGPSSTSLVLMGVGASDTSEGVFAASSFTNTSIIRIEGHYFIDL